MYAPRFVITNEILKNISQLEASKEVIENAPLVPAFEKQFQSDAIARTVHHGTHIEGNDLSLLQTKKILEGESIVAKARDIQEIINYRNVVKLLDDLSAKRGGYDEDMLLEIHKYAVEKLVPEEKRGVFRISQVVIKDEETGNIIFNPPPFIEVPYLIEDFLTWLNSDEGREIHPVLRAGIAHYVLVAIHPFVEGNGRATRAFVTLILIREGYDTKRFFAIEEHFDADTAAYYEALSSVDKQSKSIAMRDLTPWLEYFTKTVSIELAKIKDKVKKLSMDTRLKVKTGKQIALTERQMKLVEYLTNTTSASMIELRRVLPMVSDDTVLRDVTDLIEKGIIKKQGSTKASRYLMKA
ncbi:Fic family protein [Patescibacteria group bacterium]|nr:Fic family protein [Patescibacteria group bacterium]